MASQPVNIEAAKRAAEYHGEAVFEKDLKVCEYELLHWPWGEPAVYVFTLMREGDSYPPNILLDNTLLQGAYLVSIGKEEEGYTRMAQTDRYMTVYIGATTDMPSFIKAHAGLPEHIVAQALMGNPPLDPYWIYGDLFHILVTSKSRAGAGDTKATEIHLKEIVDLKDMGSKKVGTIPAYAEQIEWGRFLSPKAIPLNEENPYLTNVKGVLEGKHQLPVAERNIQGTWKGCSPAAFYNCLKYLEKKGKVSTHGKGVNFLLDWISICYRTNPTGGTTTADWMVAGSIIMFRGLGYFSSVTEVERQNSNPGSFLTQFANEINSDYPCNLGSTGKGIFVGHSTTGIGYWKAGTQIRLIIHDGWIATSGPVYVKYSGYPGEELEYPRFMRRFHPTRRGNFQEAEPKIEGPDLVLLNTTKSRWTWEEEFTSKNGVKVEEYAYEITFRDSRGAKYLHFGPERAYPFHTGVTTTCPETKFKRGTVEEIYKLIDANGHLVEAKKTVKLQHIIGTWLLSYHWTGQGSFTSSWIIYKTKKFKSGDNQEAGTWTVNDQTVVLTYTIQQKPVYRGTIDSAFKNMAGTMKTRVGKYYTGTWTATRQSDITTNPGKDQSQAGEANPQPLKNTESALSLIQ